jgi:hypothetical protein
MNNLQKFKLILINQSNKIKIILIKFLFFSFQNRLIIGQCCAALFNGDWYRARILEIDENRVRVQYLDW